MGEKKILLVEDSRVNLLVSSTMLEKWGYTTRMARNGQDAIRRAEEQPYDLVLMDLQLPVMDGFTALAHIRSMNAHYSQVPVLALTGAVVSQVWPAAKKAGFTDYILKPFKPETLYNNIHKYLYDRKNDSGVNPLQEKIEQITMGDAEFKQQLIPLYLSSFREILEDLHARKLYAKDYLRHIRHKHKATFKMLGLDMLEGVMLRMQEIVEVAALSPEKERELAVVVAEINQQAEQVIRQLEATE